MQRSSRYAGRKFSLAMLDIVLVHAAFVASFNVRFGIDLQAWRSALDSYARIFSLVSVCTVLTIDFSGLYSNWIRKSKAFLVYSAITSAGLIVLASIVLSFWQRAFEVPRTVFGLAFLIMALLIASSRLLCQRLHKSLPGAQRRVLIIENNEDSSSVLLRKFARTEGWYHVHSSLDIKDLDRLPSLLPEIDTIVIGENLPNQNSVLSMCTQAGKEVLLVPAVAQLLLFSSQTQQIDDLLMFSVEVPFLSEPQKAIKRALDLLISGLLLFLVSPLLLIVYVAVGLDSRGTAIYRQERVGQYGKLFEVLKFRTMRVDAETNSGPVLAREHDPRITRIGRVLRASRIDELPQLINVLLGEMSFVGPRPERAFFVEQFEQQTPGYRLRLNVKPGITGLAQIWGKYSTKVEDKLRLDLMYTANYSPILDMNIIIQTLRVVFMREGAEGVQEPTLSELCPEQISSQFGD